ncbi:MAG: COG1361 S-layer family protein [Nanobdellota archaeon]
MNKTLPLFLGILLILTTASVSLVSGETDSSQLQVDILKFEPKPARPGQYVTVTVELKNTGNENAKDAVMKVVDQYPFTTLSENKAMKEIGELKSQESYVHDFKLKIASDAPAGDNKLNIRYTDDNTFGHWQETSKDITVKNSYASISIRDIVTHPEDMRAGSQANLQLTIQNNADIALRDITTTLNLISNQDENIKELPFTPLKSSDEQYIDMLNPGEMKVVIYPLVVESDALPGSYKLPLSMTFYDNEGIKTEKQNIIGVTVQAQPKLDTYMDSTTIMESGQEGTVDIKFVNKGMHDLKFLEVTLEESDEYEILSGRQTYIGDLDSDDYRTQEFSIKPKTKDTKLSFNTVFQDETTTKYNKTFTVPMEYNHSIEQQQTTNPWLIILLVVVLGYVGRRIYLKRKKKQQSN